MRVAFLAFDACALWQVTLLQKFLRDADWRMETLTIGGKEVVSDGGLTIQATETLECAHAADYDLVLMAGGYMTEKLAQHPSVHRFLTESTGIVAASCASAVIVAAAGLINGPFTTTRTTVERFAPYFANGTFVDEDVCVNGNVITSKGYAHYEFTVAVLEKIGLTSQKAHIRKAALKLSRNEPRDERQNGDCI